MQGLTPSKSSLKQTDVPPPFCNNDFGFKAYGLKAFRASGLKLEGSEGLKKTQVAVGRNYFGDLASGADPSLGL